MYRGKGDVGMSRRVRLTSPDASREPSGENASALTAPLLPFSVELSVSALPSHEYK